MIAPHIGTPAVVKSGDSTPPVSIAQRFARESSGRQRERICWWPSEEAALDPPGGIFHRETGGSSSAYGSVRKRLDHRRLHVRATPKTFCPTSFQEANRSTK
jgi:hypothetical protein